MIQLVTEAASIFLDFGMQPFTQRAMRLAESLGVHIPTAPARHAAHPDNLSGREVEVLVQMTRGRSREEIAGDLVLGQQTIAGHLASIFDKIRVGDEATAAAYARERGLVVQVEQGRLRSREEPPAEVLKRSGSSP